jgi:uncharacterized protein (TIGR02284 family)
LAIAKGQQVAALVVAGEVKRTNLRRGSSPFLLEDGHLLTRKTFLIARVAKGELEMADNTRDLIKDLIQTCKDGETGYAHAAGVASDPQLKAYFSEQSLERARFGQELRAAAERLGDKPEPSGSVSAVLHRVWFEAKATVGLGDQSILDSVEQGEDRAKKDYEKALSTQLPSGLRAIIQRQSDSVFKAHDYVRDMRDGQARPGEQVA